MSAVAAAVVITAVMAFAMMVIVVAAPGIGVVVQSAGQQVTHSLIRVAKGTAVDGDPGLSQSIAGSAADAAADQRLHTQSLEHTRQGSMAAAAGRHHLSGQDLAVLDIVNLKGSGVAKMLENEAVFVSNRDFHKICSFDV